MDYLFNIYLASHLNNEEMIVGNFIAESIKYSKKKTYSSEVENGMNFHRMICGFIDNNQAFVKSKSRVSPRYNRYSAMIVMLYYSHFMAKDWTLLTGERLDCSIKKFKFLIDSSAIVPDRFKELVSILTSEKGLKQLTTVGGIHSFISELSNKGFCLGYLQYALQDILVNYNSFYDDFKEFLPTLNKFALEYCEANFPELAKAS